MIGITKLSKDKASGEKIIHLKLLFLYIFHQITSLDKERIKFISFYPMTIRSNTPIALCESDSRKIKDFGSLLFFKVGAKSGYVPG
ncbi:hypothetical protein [uncultured Clostridium sp.]|uniref:hypothetical protein n=1 Tax=uncultured Clostridium sp. TaxID=59620 RepID=UPI0028EE02D1|nr:hypothetical protein [uncultured Clostridium sp.]